MVEHPYGWLSILPPVVAIFLAIVTRRVVVSLFFGVFVGGLILAGGNPWTATVATFEDHLWPALANEEKLQVFAFTLLMGAMVGIISRAAGMRGLVGLVAPLARSRRGGQLTTWLLGLFVFFDDYANTLLLGNTLRPLTDRLKISREKLAYLVDSTAAPVSGLAIVSTWVAGEIGYIQDGLDKLPAEIEWSALTLFIGSIPYRFYVLWTLAMVPLVALLNRDFGPMWRAERKAWTSGTEGTESSEIKSATAPSDTTPARWHNAVVPICVTVCAILWLMYVTGRSSFLDSENPSLMDVFGEADAYGSLLWGSLAGAVVAAVMARVQRLLDFAQIKESAFAGALLMTPALVILWLASALSTMTGNKPSEADAIVVAKEHTIAVTETIAIYEATGELTGCVEPLRDRVASTPAAAIALVEHGADATKVADLFVLHGIPADTVGDWMKRAGAKVDSLQVSKQEGRAKVDAGESLSWPPAAYAHHSYRLYSGGYLSGLLQDRIPVGALPTVIFILSAAIAFATGTSWGTMGIVMPLAIPLVYRVATVAGSAPTDSDPILLCSVGGVLAGAIFGDHCSPISDTTILSSQASGCDHVAHVWTQLPYAVLVAALAILFGTIPTGWNVNVWWLLPVGIAGICGWLLWQGKPADGPADAPPQ